MHTCTHLSPKSVGRTRRAVHGTTEDSATLQRGGVITTTDSTGRGEKRRVNLWRRPDAARILHKSIPGSESPALVHSEIQVPRKQQPLNRLVKVYLVMYIIPPGEGRTAVRIRANPKSGAK